MSKSLLNKFIMKLPKKYRWSVHNLVAHPVSEVAYLCGFENLSNKIHDYTVPDHEEGTGRG